MATATAHCRPDQLKAHGRVIDAERGLDDATPQELNPAAWDRFFDRFEVQPSCVDYTLEW